jgi:isoquinoline 1-oxidoreductase beta subunit
VVEARGGLRRVRAAGLSELVRTPWSREDDIKGGYYPDARTPRAEIDLTPIAKSWPGTTVIVGASPSWRVRRFEASWSRGRCGR